MAGQALVLDASVGVKWFSDIGEADIPRARAMLKAHAVGDISLLVPELFFHEISNALVHKKTISKDLLEEAISTLLALGLSVFPLSKDHLVMAVHLARKADITEYDAYYIVAAINAGCPLVTANPRHQREGLGCHVITLEEWQ